MSSPGLTALTLPLLCGIPHTHSEKLQKIPKLTLLDKWQSKLGAFGCMLYWQYLLLVFILLYSSFKLVFVIFQYLLP